MKKSTLGKDTLILSIMTFMTILTWVGFDVYRAATKSTITQVTQEQMRPLSPQIDKSLVFSLKNNLSFSQTELDLASQAPAATEAGQKQLPEKLSE